jgi:multidrug resistance efflux pump
MKRRWILVGLVVLIAVTVLFLFFSKKTGKPESIRTTGIVEGLEVNISPMAPGTISKQWCREGDTVREGDTLIELESEDLKASVEEAVAAVEKAKAGVRVSESAIKASKANITTAEAEIRNAEADVEKARVQMEEAKRHMNRLKALYEREIISRESSEMADTDYDTTVANDASSKAKLTAASSTRDAALAQLTTAENQLDSAKANLGQSEANLSYAHAKLAQTIIKSPISGTVVFKALDQGEWASPGVTILTLVDLSNLYIRADVEETMIGDIALNSEAMISAGDSTNRVFKGRVSEIGRYAEFATQKDVLRGRQDIKTFRVKIAVDDSSDGFLKPGMTVEVEIPKRKQNASKQ